jgi:CHAD domain-containing protein
LKPERIDLRGANGAIEIARRVLQTRLREARRLAVGLDLRDQRSLHDFRIACKRLRYALERFEEREPALHASAERLARLQDALGEAHDRDVLLAVLPPLMAQTERRLQAQRETSVDDAVHLWAHAQEAMRRCPLIVFE